MLANIVGPLPDPACMKASPSHRVLNTRPLWYAQGPEMLQRMVELEVRCRNLPHWVLAMCTIVRCRLTMRLHARRASAAADHLAAAAARASGRPA
jgi:hypothetical protein